MKRPLIYSALLHFTVIILLLVGFYNPFERVRSKEAPLMIEFVKIADISAAPVLAPESIKEPEQPQPPAPTPPPPPQPEPPQPEPPQPAPEPQPEPEPVKPEPKPEPQPEPKPVEAEPIPDPKAKKKPKEKEKLKEEKKKQKAEITLDKKKKPSTKNDEKKDDKKKDKKKSSKPSKSLEDIMNEALNEQDSETKDDAPSKGRGAPAETIGPILTTTEIGALAQHFSRCWLIPAGLRDARNIIVKIDISFDKEGIINKAEIVEKGKVSQDSAYRTAAESARRAVLDPNCSQLPLPAEKLEKFKKEGLRFSFDPKAMF